MFKMKRNKDCDAINTAVHRLQKRVNERLINLINLTEKFAAEVKTIFEQRNKLVAYLNRVGEKDLIDNLSRFCTFANKALFATIREKILDQPYCLAEFWTELVNTHNFWVILDESYVLSLLDFHTHATLVTLVENICTFRMPATEEIPSTLNNLYLTFVGQALIFLISHELSRNAVLNYKKKSRLKYRYEKVTLLILWRCGDVEQNPGPAISDIARDFCKKMISLLVAQYQGRQLGQRPIQADYKKKSAGWPGGFEFKDPSKCTNDVRDNMLNTIQKLCISSGVEVPIEWNSLYEKYQELQTPQCTKAKKEEIAGHLHSWLSRRRKFETTDQLFDSLKEMSESDRAEVLENLIERLREFKPNLPTQNVQSQKTGSESREMETCSHSTVCAATNCNESITLSVTDIEIPAGDMTLARSPGTSTWRTSNDNSKSEVEGQSTANKGFVTENTALESALAENVTSFLGLLSDDFGCFAASATETETDTLPNAQDSNNERINTNNEKHMKRKLDTLEAESDNECAVKRHKTRDCHEATHTIHDSGKSDSEEMLRNSQDGDILDNGADTTLEDLMKIIEPELQVPDQDHSARCRPDGLAEGDNMNESLLNAPEKYLPGDSFCDM